MVQLLWLIPSLAMGIYYGLASGMWQIALMSLATALIGLLMRFRKDKSVELRITKRGVFRNGHKVWLPYRFWSKALRESYAAQLEGILATLPQEVSKTRCDPLSFVAGYNLELNLAEDGPHLFLVGPTGSGKSRWLNLFLRTLSGEPILLLADYKGGATLSRFGQCMTDLDSIEVRRGFWNSLGELLKEREEYLVLHRVSRANETSLRPVVVVVDELAAAIREDREALPALSALAARGRSLAVHLVCASQSIHGVPRELLVNLGLRIVLAGIDEVDALTLGAKIRPQAVTGVGCGLIVGGKQFRFPFSQAQTQAT